MGKRLTQKQLAEALGLSQQLVSVMVRRGMPLDVAGAIAWRGNNLSVAKSKPPPAGAHDGAGQDVRAHYNKSRARKEAALADLRELEARKLRGELLEAADVLPQFQRAGMAVRDAMLSIPGRIAAALATMNDERDIERLLTRTIREELTRLADSVKPNA